jgi:hypothetical protein
VSIKVGDKVRIGNFIKRVHDDDADFRLEYTDDVYVDAMLTTIGRVGVVRRIHGDDLDDTPGGPCAEVAGVDPDRPSHATWTFAVRDLEVVK